MKQSVLVGLSGGVDSAMTAYLLKEQGYKVTGVHLKLHNEEKADYHQGINHIAEKLGIDWLDYNAVDLFEKEVIGYFTRFHLEGRTPSPCAHCNPAVKWKLLVDIANSAGINKVATGHYIRIHEENCIHRIYRGIDKLKDQSYYMWQLGEGILSRSVTPLGDYTKQDIRNLAERIGLEKLSGSGESSGLCFAGGRSCEELLNTYIPGLPERIEPGIVTDKNGNKIGTHKGYIYYTIGQKKDLQLDSTEKLSVSKIDAVNNVLVAEPWQNLYHKEFIITDFIFADLNECMNISDMQVMIRGFGLNPAGNAKITLIDSNKIKVNLENPAWAPAPGQPAVFYSGDKLLGGGIIY